MVLQTGTITTFLFRNALYYGMTNGVNCAVVTIQFECNDIFRKSRFIIITPSPLKLHEAAGQKGMDSVTSSRGGENTGT